MWPAPVEVRLTFDCRYLLVDCLLDPKNPHLRLCWHKMHMAHLVNSTSICTCLVAFQVLFQKQEVARVLG